MQVCMQPQGGVCIHTLGVWMNYLEDEDHIKMSESMYNSFKADDINVFDGQNEWRPFGQVDKTATCRHQHHRVVPTHTLELQLTDWNLELHVIGHTLHKPFELQIQFTLPFLLPLLLEQLVRVVRRSRATDLKVLGLIHHLAEKLHILDLLPTQHDS